MLSMAEAPHISCAMAGPESEPSQDKGLNERAEPLLGDGLDRQPATRDAGGCVELSVVIPCLNEADTLESCLEKAQRGLRAARAVGEIVVADNGSTDGSVEIAHRMGVRVINVPEKGYGNALMGGIAAARGKFIIMGDADGSYDFEGIPQFVEQTPGRLRSSPRMPTAHWRRDDRSRRNAFLASLDRQSAFLCIGQAMVQVAHQRYPLRNAGLHEVSL